MTTLALSRADLALILSVFSLGIALATFVWRIVYDIYYDAPRIKTSVEALEMMGQGHPVGVYVVNVTNKGKRPMRVTSLWLGLGRPVRPWMRRTFKVLPKSVRNKVYGRFYKTGLMMPGLEYAAFNTQIPTRLDVGDQANIYYVRDTVHEKLKNEAEDYRFLYAAVGTTLKSKSSKLLRLKSEDSSEPTPPPST